MTDDLTEATGLTSMSSRARMRAARSTPAPVATVVVATHNRCTLLGRLLVALAQQVGAPAFEVVVVDDASSDGTWDELEQGTASSPFPLRPIRVPVNRGPAHARNLGWRASAADVVCFTDDDCIPVATWLAELLRRTDQADIVQGRTEPNPDQLDRRGPFSRTMIVPYEQGFYETCNIAFRRSVLDRLGGFDESFRYPFGEDTDLAWRARRSGARTTFATDALVHHEVWPSDLRATFRDAKRLEGIVHVTRNHPDLRRQVGWSLFARTSHPAALAALAGLLMVLSRPRSRQAWAVAGLLGVRYGWECRRHRPPPPARWQWAGVVPASLTVDLYESAVMAAASIHYRTVLL